jgi:hypothetical protein
MFRQFSEDFHSHKYHKTNIYICQVVMYGLFYECKFLTIEETKKQKKTTSV